MTWRPRSAPVEDGTLACHAVSVPAVSAVVVGTQHQCQHAATSAATCNDCNEMGKVEDDLS